jgi:hypothetical protein
MRMNFRNSSFIRQSWLGLTYNATPQLNLKQKNETITNIYVRISKVYTNFIALSIYNIIYSKPYLRTKTYH